VPRENCAKSTAFEACHRPVNDRHGREFRSGTSRLSPCRAGARALRARPRSRRLWQAPAPCRPCAASP